MSALAITIEGHHACEIVRLNQEAQRLLNGLIT